jgi:hypothetical protein
VRVLSHELPGRQRKWAQPRRPRRRLFHLELEQTCLRIDRLDRAREHDAAAMQEARAEDERGRLPANRVEHDAFDDTDSRPAGAHTEPLGSLEPVLEHVAAPAEHVRPHNCCLPQARRARNL